MTLQQSGIGGAPPPAAVTAGRARAQAIEQPAQGSAARRLVSRVLFLAGLVFMTIVFVFPFVWLVSASLKTRADVFSNDLFKFPLHFENYATVFQVAPVANWFLNSI